MPYPYKNDLGKNPPPGSSAAGKEVILNYYNTVTPALYHSKVVGNWEESLIEQTKKLNEVTAELKAEQQKKMMDQLFGAKPTTIKFPNVQPIQFKGDFPKNLAANKYGMPDLKSIPEEGPAKPWEPPSWNSAAEQIQKLVGEGLISKEELYAQMYGKVIPPTAPTSMQKLDGLLKEVYDGKLNTTGKPKPVAFKGFTQPATTLGDENSFKIDMKFKVEGIEGLDDKKLGAHQLVSKEFIYGSYGKTAVEKIVDNMLRQIKLQIMEQIKKAK